MICTTLGAPASCALTMDWDIVAFHSSWERRNGAASASVTVTVVGAPCDRAACLICSRNRSLSLRVGLVMGSVKLDWSAAGSAFRAS